MKKTRRECAREMAKLDLPGYGIGGLSVGETQKRDVRHVGCSLSRIAGGKAALLMGVGSPDCLVEACCAGWICSIACWPRAWRAMVRYLRGMAAWSSQRNVRARFWPARRRVRLLCLPEFSRAYIRHLFKAGEILALRLCSMHNIRFLVRLMEDMRRAIEADSLRDFSEEFFATHARDNW